MVQGILRTGRGRAEGGKGDDKEFHPGKGDITPSSTHFARERWGGDDLVVTTMFAIESYRTTIKRLHL